MIVNCTKWKKGLSVILVATLLLPSLVTGLFFVGSHKAEAVVPVFDAANYEVNSATAFATGQLYQKEFFLDPSLWSVIKTLVLRGIVAAIIDWINSGFEGGPTFVSDPEAFFLGIADQVTGAFLHEYGLEGICDAFDFSLDIQIALIQSQYSTDTQEFACTIGTAIENVQDFLDDFNQGGWTGWASINQSENNPFGVYLGTSLSLAKRQRESLTRTENEVVGAGGFISLRFERCAQHASDGSCARFEVETPGQAIVGELQATLGSTVKQLEQSDELREGLAAIFDALIDQLIVQGLRALSGSSSVFDTPGSGALETARQNLINQINRELQLTTDPASIAFLQGLLQDAQNATNIDQIQAISIRLIEYQRNGGGNNPPPTGGGGPPPAPETPGGPGDGEDTGEAPTPPPAPAPPA